MSDIKFNVRKLTSTVSEFKMDKSSVYGIRFFPCASRNGTVLHGHAEFFRKIIEMNDV